MEQNLDKIDWNYLCENKCPRAVRLIEKNLGKLKIADWAYNISRNPYAIHLIEPNLDKITQDSGWGGSWGWCHISLNPNAISLLEKYPDKIEWDMLSENPNAIHLLEKNKDKINWYNFSANPSIFKIDYEQLYRRIEPLYEELMQKCSHPSRVKHYLEKYGSSHDLYYLYHYNFYDSL